MNPGIFEAAPDYPGFALVPNASGGVNGPFVDVVYKDATGQIVGTVFRLWKDAQNLWEFDRPGVGSPAPVRTQNGKFQEKA